jgi:hypothetical protein
MKRMFSTQLWARIVLAALLALPAAACGDDDDATGDDSTGDDATGDAPNETGETTGATDTTDTTGTTGGAGAYRAHCYSPSLMECYEYDAANAAALASTKQTCEAIRNTWTEGTCPTEKALGCCRREQAPGNFQWNCLYEGAGSTLEQYQQGCARAGGTVVPADTPRE